MGYQRHVQELQGRAKRLPKADEQVQSGQRAWFVHRQCEWTWVSLHQTLSHGVHVRSQPQQTQIHSSAQEVCGQRVRVHGCSRRLDTQRQPLLLRK